MVSWTLFLFLSAETGWKIMLDFSNFLDPPAPELDMHSPGYARNTLIFPIVWTGASLVSIIHIYIYIWSYTVRIEIHFQSASRLLSVNPPKVEAQGGPNSSFSVSFRSCRSLEAKWAHARAKRARRASNLMFSRILVRCGVHVRRILEGSRANFRWILWGFWWRISQNSLHVSLPLRKIVHAWQMVSHEQEKHDVWHSFKRRWPNKKLV